MKGNVFHASYNKKKEIAPEEIIYQQVNHWAHTKTKYINELVAWEERSLNIILFLGLYINTLNLIS